MNTSSQLPSNPCFISTQTISNRNKMQIENDCTERLTEANFTIPILIPSHCDYFQGYYGDGFTCLPQSSCRHEPSLCSPDASCVAAGENQFACICNEGYIGDGANCKPRPRHESNFLLVNQGMATHRIPFSPTPGNRGSPIDLHRLHTNGNRD